ncbi:thiol:disulfide interchange protein DsbC [Marinicella pacifica]|jgi:thiol:disulfide interchange protein DsbC|uniref:Thiol:disulfide interchange protein n=1 Tax=Marinicella pacifica TaxID=1171543 RepID=A0A917CL46_9GAMM|nr:thioredoxin fold domain-containing protein [Marinicella pacifica]GGF92284.1 thiol:disulfide interchange protein DsbC [Marinicella pacifica]
MNYKTITLALLLTALNAIADNNTEPYQQALAKITAPNVKVTAVFDTPISDIKELMVDTGRGTDIVYMSKDGAYLIQGSIFDIDRRVDITDQKKAGLRAETLKKFGDEARINFFPDDMKYEVTVFTDIDCGYCRKLHGEMQGYNDLGIGISYLFFPRSGLKTASYDKAVSVWCAADQHKAMDQAKAGVEVAQKKCDNPVTEQYQAGLAAGVTGTPALILNDGTMMPGYMPPEQLKQRLDALQASK